MENNWGECLLYFAADLEVFEREDLECYSDIESVWVELIISLQQQTITQKMADQGRSDLYVVFTMSLRTWIKTIVNKFAISNHMALILGVHALRSYLKLICECELHSLPNKNVSGAKNHGKNYIKVRPPLVRHF